LEEVGIEGFVKRVMYDSEYRKRRKGMFLRSDYRYDEKLDEYESPSGPKLAQVSASAEATAFFGLRSSTNARTAKAAS
jgi:hypothetical protein